jgi:thiosulfate/3-mercaptopyruvate sulfurtransferase
MVSTRPRYLVETDWLQAHLGEPDLRVLDCTVLGGRHTDAGVTRSSGRDAWTRGHIPTSGFVDVLDELSDRDSSIPLMMPPPDQVAQVMSRLGVGDGTRAVLYDASADRWAHMWATRVWWILRVCGFDQAAVLNGGWHKWLLEGRPVSTEPSPYPPAEFTVRFRPELLANKQDVLAAIDDGTTCMINALSAEDHTGARARYGRAGHIPSSVNVPTIELVDPVTHAYLPEAELRARFAEAGALERERVITYCGGGVAATSDALVLTLLGVPNVAVYDGSLFEWAADQVLPMTTGPEDGSQDTEPR